MENNNSIYATSVEVDVKRCLCIHSVAQLIDITLQSLLYQRQIIPEPVATLLKSDSHSAEQFRTIYEKVTRILQETFRTPNIGQINEFVILFGGTPYSPKEIYRIPVPICRNGEEHANEAEERENERRRDRAGEEMQGEKGCGPECEQLSAKEKRLIFSAVALNKTAVGHFESCPVPAKTDKVFMFIRSSRGPLNTWTEGLIEDESFELPEEKLQQRRKIRQLRIQVRSSCRNGRETPIGAHLNGGGHHRTRAELAANNGTNGHGKHDDDDGREEEEDQSEDEGSDENALSMWYRIAPFFVSL